MTIIFSKTERVAWVETNDPELLKDSGYDDFNPEFPRKFLFHILPLHFDDLSREERDARKAFYDTLNEAYVRANPPGTPASEEALWVCISYIPWLKNEPA